MVKDIATLDLNTDYDILYFYRNAASYHEHLDLLSDRHLSDINICLLCYGFVETGVMHDLRLETVDCELAYLMRDTGCKKEEAGCSETKNSTEDVHLVATASEKPVDSPKADSEDDAGCLAADQKSIISSGRFYINNLAVLLRPFIGVCDKQVVDVIFFVYRMTGISHFDLLFREFGNAKDLLIELHLLVVRGSRSRSFDFKDIKESLTRDSAGDKASKNDEVDFFDESSDRASDGENDREIELGYFSDVKEDYTSVRPFAISKNTNPLIHLDQAKRLLLSFTIKDQNFYIENLSTYLSLKFDRALYLTYIKTPRTPHFYRSLSKFINPPFFLYKNVDIRYLLIENIKTYVRNDKNGSKIILDLESAGGGEEDNAYKIYKHSLVCNCYTLRYFVEFAMATFADYEAPIESYPLIARSLHYFVREYRHPSLFRILHGLIESRLDRVYKEVREWILLNIDLYMDVFYKPFAEADLSGIDLEESLWPEWAVKEAGQGDGDAKGGDSTAAETPGDEDAGKENTRYSKTPSLEDCEDDQVLYFTQPTVLQPLHLRISNFLLVKFYKPFDMVATIDGFLVSAACDRPLKIHVLNAAASLARVETSTRDKIIAHLFATEGTPWRYRAALLNKRDVLVRLGASPSLFAQFATDRVYFVRRLAEKSL